MTSLTQQFVDVDDATLEVFRGGTGPPIICCQHPHCHQIPIACAAPSIQIIRLILKP
jgi:hypothetical protein